MTGISSKIIIGATPTPATEQELRTSFGAKPDAVVSMSVFEVRVDGRTRYCCWSGGELLRDPNGIGGPMPHLTQAGQGACEALMRLPYLYGRDGEFLHSLVFHEVKLGKTPLQRKIIAAFRMTADANAVICFVGDLAVELDGHMSPAFNLKGAVDIADVAGMMPPGSRRHG